MKFYAVYAPNPAGLTELQQAERTVFIPQGFCWPAFFFSGLWLLYRKQWLVLVAYIAVVVSFAFLTQFLNMNEGAQTIISLIMQLWLGFEARNLQMAALEKRGFTRIDTVFAPRQPMAEYQFFAQHEAHA